MTIADIQTQISRSSVREVIEAAITRAKNDPAHAILEVIEARALQRADEIDSQLKVNEPVGELAGVPFIAKDNMLTFGSKTTAAARLLENFEAPFQAEAVERLEAAGAICIAKANLDAFAHGGSTENSAYGPTLNPSDSSRVPGGSSGGSAAVVASGIVPFALGTDTGGSIRQPASFTGVVGVKPTYGSVSRYGVVAMASSTDVIGVLTSTVSDAELVMKTIAGKDAKDSTTIVNPYDKQNSPVKKKIALVKSWLGEGTDTDVTNAVRDAAKIYESRGYVVEEIEMPILDHALAVYYIVVPAEIASNLARYDGIRYGNRPAGTTDLNSVYTQTRSAGFMPENKRRIMIGNYVLSSGYYDAYFQKAAKVRTLIVQGFEKLFESYDALIGPVAPTVAFKLGQNTHDPLAMYLADQMTVSASLAGLPALSIPLQTTGLPIGLQIIGSNGSDMSLIELAKELEEKSA